MSRGLGELLGAVEAEILYRLPFFQRRKNDICGLIVVIVCLDVFLDIGIESQEALELYSLTRSPEHVDAARYFDVDRIDGSSCHLSCKESVPDELIEPVLVRRKRCLDALG